MMKEKEPMGHKQHVKLMVMKREPITVWTSVPEKFAKVSDGFRKIPSASIWVKTDDICTKDKLAFTIHRNFGEGEFSVLFVSRRLENKKYNPKFKCHPYSCAYHAAKKCRIYSRWQQGWNCKKNKKFQTNWTPRARLTITEFPCPEDDQNNYKFTWDTSKDLMRRFWFWKG